jgi:hypothetical protein
LGISEPFIKKIKIRLVPKVIIIAVETPYNNINFIE